MLGLLLDRKYLYWTFDFDLILVINLGHYLLHYKANETNTDDTVSTIIEDCPFIGSSLFRRSTELDSAQNILVL